MLGFTYYTPTKVEFGKCAVEKVGALMKQFGGTRVLIHYGGHLIYHLGDTALFSDLQLVARRGDKVDVALMCIGGHYTMDRYDAVTAADVERTLRVPIAAHVPSSRDVAASINSCLPLTVSSPDHPVSSAVRHLARTRLAPPIAVPRLPAGGAVT